MNITSARKILKNKNIGITCHNSINLAKKAINLIKLTTLLLVLFFIKNKNKQ